MVIQSKANTIIRLSKILKKSKIPLSYVFQIKSWKKDKKIILTKISSIFKKKKLAIRSSAADEDKINKSSAGKYSSFLNVHAVNKEKIEKYINRVIKSYNKEKNNNNNQILIQEMIDGIKMSGVLFSCDNSDNSPYYVINYDDISGLTDTVTSGSKFSNKTLYVFKKKKELLKSKRFIKIIDCSIEIEKKLKNNFLDIEFGMKKRSGDVYIFQVRPIVINKKINKSFENEILKKLLSLNLYINKKFDIQEGLIGKKNIFGQMPDWNPAEIIGQSPSNLAFSLYSKLITDSNWLKARKIMGYNYFRKEKLMHFFCGKPYIDVRKSLNSFIPLNLSKNIKSILINNGITRLTDNPNFHDKIEFEIIPTSYFFDFKKKLKKISPKLSTSQLKSIENEYLNLFLKNIDKNSQGSLEKNIKKIKYLEFLQNKKIYEINDKIEDIKTIFDECVNYGVIPFSILARHAFISKEFLNSLERQHLLTKKKIKNFESSLNTITAQFLNDLDLSKNNKLKFKEFVNRYGHLRPGTYDITSPRYDQNIKEFFFRKTKKIKTNYNKPIKFNMNKLEISKIEKLLLRSKIPLTPSDFFKYLSNSIKLREYAKFIFTKSVSIILEKIRIYALKNRISLEEISNLNIEQIYKKKKSISEIKKLNLIAKKENYINSLIKLPQLIIDKTNIFVVPFQVSLPNYVTKKILVSDIVYLENKKKVPDLENKIIIIKNADPGFDWIFGHKIKGLITQFGGANSHMTIRCSEQDLPAAIGCGNQTFKIIKKSKKIELNCKLKTIKVIN